jgi:hypothetical protein
MYYALVAAEIKNEITKFSTLDPNTAGRMRIG